MAKTAHSRRADHGNIVIVVGLALLGLAAITSPERLLAWSPPCLFTFFADLRCPGCGMMHALIDLLHGDLQGAWEHNRSSLLVLPLLLWLAARHLRLVGRSLIPL